MKKMNQCNGQRSVEDFETDSVFLKALADAVELGEIEELAIAKALDSHPVTKYVKHLPRASLSLNPATSEFYNPKMGEIPYVAWTLPMQDKTLSERLGCGLFGNRNSKNLLITACTKDMRDYAKAMSLHCWTLGCVNCGNSTAIRMGARAESRILAWKDLQVRERGRGEEPRHWVLSPPQEWAIRMLQLPTTYKKLYKKAVDMAEKYGLHSAAVVMHPWRLNGDPKKGIKATMWEAGPHFHFVGYGFVDTEGFLNENPGWVIKLVHKEPIRSVRQTIAYLLTHAGLPSYMRLEDDIDFTDIFELFNVWASFTPKEDADAYAWKEPEDIPHDDWVHWTKKKMRGIFHSLTFYGGLWHKSIRIYDTHSEQVVRQCPVCEAPLGIYDGVHDCNPEPAEFKRESKIYVAAGNYNTIKDIENRHRQALFFEGNTLLDFALAVPQLSCPESQGVQKHDPKHTKEALQNLRGHTIVYFDHPSGYGYATKRVTFAEARRLEEEGVITPRSEWLKAGSP